MHANSGGQLRKMGYYNFVKDLEASKASVKKVGDYYSNLTFHVDYEGGKDYDITVLKGELMFRVEVKEDLLYEKTGNVAIEFESRGKASGILSSTADYWAYVLGDKIYLVKTLSLYETLRKGDFKKVKGGDNRTSRLYLVPLLSFKEIFKELP